MAEVLNLLPSNHWPSQWRRLAHLDKPRPLCAVQSDCLPVRVISDADAIAGNGIITFCNQSCAAAKEAVGKSCRHSIVLSVSDMNFLPRISESSFSIILCVESRLLESLYSPTYEK